MKKTYITIIFSLVCVVALAQIAEKDIPHSFTLESVRSVKTKKLPPINQDEIKKREQTFAERNTKKLLFAHVFDVDISPENSGTLEILPNGDKLWRIKIVSRNAYSLNFTFGEYHIPAGAKLFLYNTEKTYIKGAFTHRNNKKYGSLAVAPVKGEEVIIEYFEPAKAAFQGKLRLTKIGHDYKNILQTIHNQRIGNCHININCPEGNDWQIEKRAVCKFIISNSELCSGVMINNTEQDGRPYLLTANHCIGTQTDAQNSVFYFNYECPDCEGDTGDESQTLSGADLIATTTKLDFCLVELSTEPPSEYEMYLAGWNRSTEPAQNSVCIHHPDGYVKKMAIDNDPPITGDFGEGFDFNSHWQVETWEKGATERGSSGSPLFDENHRIVGCLTGGEAYCGYPVNDYFAKISRSWDDYNEPDKQLKHWLDPIGTGVETLNGFDPNQPLYTTDVQLYRIVSPSRSSCHTEGINPAIMIKNKGSDTLKNVTVYCLLDGNELHNIQWQGELATNEKDTIFFPQRLLSEGSYSFKAYTGLPNNASDENHLNDTLFVQFNHKYGVPVELVIKTDHFGFETTWQLKSSQDNNVLYSGGPYHDDMEYTEKFCLSGESEYTFTIFDSEGDGICCDYGHGFYTLSNMMNDEILGEGGEFNSLDSCQFFLPLAITDKMNKKNINVFPNPASSILTIQSGNDNLKSLSLFDVYGRKMYEKKCSGDKESLNVSAIAGGIYILQIHTIKAKYNYKIWITP